MNNSMKFDFQTWLVIGLAVALIGIFAADQFGGAPSTSMSPGKITQTKMPEPTGRVSDTASALLKASADEQTEFSEAQTELELLSADSQAIDDFGQVVRDDEF